MSIKFPMKSLEKEAKCWIKDYESLPGNYTDIGIRESGAYGIINKFLHVLTEIKKPRELTIVIHKGVVTEIENLPENWTYSIAER